MKYSFAAALNGVAWAVIITAAMAVLGFEAFLTAVSGFAPAAALAGAVTAHVVRPLLGHRGWRWYLLPLLSLFLGAFLVSLTMAVYMAVMEQQLEAAASYGLFFFVFGLYLFTLPLYPVALLSHHLLRKVALRTVPATVTQS